MLWRGEMWNSIFLKGFECGYFILRSNRCSCAHWLSPLKQRAAAVVDLLRRASPVASAFSFSPATDGLIRWTVLSAGRTNMSQLHRRCHMLRFWCVISTVRDMTPWLTGSRWVIIALRLAFFTERTLITNLFYFIEPDILVMCREPAGSNPNARGLFLQGMCQYFPPPFMS